MDRAMKHNRQRGAVLVYILIGVALLAGLTAVFMGGGGQQASTQRNFNLANDLSSQIQLIRAGIQECVLTYPNGDSTMPASPALVGGQDIVRPYPLIPSNTYLESPAGPGTANMEDIRCAGNPGNNNNHAKIFSSGTGKFLPRVPSLMEPWRYYNGADGVFFLISTTKTDSHIKWALEKVNEQFSSCEADVIDATGVMKSITTDGWNCAKDELCLRVWLVTKPSAKFPDETGCPPV